MFINLLIFSGKIVVYGSLFFFVFDVNGMGDGNDSNWFVEFLSIGYRLFLFCLYLVIKCRMRVRM